jgi:hypothetical protein
MEAPVAAWRVALRVRTTGTFSKHVSPVLGETNRHADGILQGIRFNEGFSVSAKALTGTRSR